MKTSMMASEMKNQGNCRKNIQNDFHVVIADPTSSGRTMVAEVVDPACSVARDSLRLSALKATRQKFVGLYWEPHRGSFKPVPAQPVVILVGVGFFDQCGAQHEPRGASPQCIELHPVP